MHVKRLGVEVIYLNPLLSPRGERIASVRINWMSILVAAAVPVRGAGCIFSW